jgi:hypothetical protein
MSSESAQGAGSSKDIICTPFDPEPDGNRTSWAPYIGRLQTPKHALTASNTVSTRQLYISNQVNRVREKVAELEEMSTVLRSSSNSSREHGPRPASGTDHDVPPTAVAAAEEMPNDSSDPVGVQDDKLEHANRRIEALNSRIRELELQRGSSWALGLSDEPPPGYTE